MKLTIELVPRTAWYSNVRSAVSQEEWDRLRRICYRLANYKCEICGGVGDKHPVECHEIWEYNDELKVQTLVGLISLCPPCHKVKHVGLAKIKGEEELVIKQLVKVNQMHPMEAYEYIAQSFRTWAVRSKHQWVTDISYLEKYPN